MQRQNSLSLQDDCSVDVLIQGMDVSIINDFSKERTSVSFPIFHLCYDLLVSKQEASEYISSQLVEHKKAQESLKQILMNSYKTLNHHITQEQTRNRLASTLSEQTLNNTRRVVRAKKGLSFLFSKNSFEERYNCMFALAQKEQYGCEQVHQAISCGVSCVNTLTQRFMHDNTIRDQLLSWAQIQQDLEFLSSQLSHVSGQSIDLLVREKEFYCPQETIFLA